MTQGGKTLDYRFHSEEAADATGKTEQFIGFTRRVGEKNAGVSGNLFKFSDICKGSGTYDSEFTIFPGKGILVSGQFSNLLTAEDSTEMSYKNKGGSAVIPEF